MEHFTISVILTALSVFTFVNSTLISINNISNVLPVSAVTLGQNYATIVYASPSVNSSSVYSYNVVTNSCVPMAISVPYSIQSIGQIDGYNNNTKNLYMISNSTQYTVLTQNMQNVSQSWGASGNTTLYMASLGYNTTTYYDIITTNTNGNKVSASFNQYSMSNKSILSSQSISSEEGISVLYNNLKVYFVTGVSSHQNTYNSANIRIYNQTLSQIKNISIFVYEIKIAASSSYLAISCGTEAQVFSLSNYTNIYNKTINQYSIVDISITNTYLIMTTSNGVYHYNVTNGKYIGFFDFTFLNGAMLMVDVAEYGAFTWVCVWYAGAKNIYIFNLTSTNSTSNISNSTNTTNTTNIVNTTIYATNITNITITANATNNSTNETTAINSTVINSLNQTQPITISKQLKIKLTNILVSFNVVRVNIFQRMYFFIDKLKLHNYHQTQYDGAIKLILDFMNAFQNNCWDLINFQQVMDWINQPFGIPSYSNFTNPKFYLIEKSDSFFLQNTKDFFLLYLPVIALGFFALNRLFHWIIKYKISKFLRFFSVFLTLIMLIFVQNITMLVFLACHHMRNNMFRFNWVLSFLQAFVILFIGLCIILAFSFFYLSRYLYKKKSKMFLVNLYPSNNSLAIMTIKLAIKPIIQSIIQVFLYNHYDIQIFTLSLIDVISFVIFSANQLIFGDFKVQALFVSQCVLDLCISFINFLLYLKYVVYPELSQIIQSWIICTLYVIASILLLTVLYQIIETVKKIIRQIKKGKKKKKKVLPQHKFEGRSEKQRSKKGIIVKFALKQFKKF